MGFKLLHIISREALRTLLARVLVNTGAVGRGYYGYCSTNNFDENVILCTLEKKILGI